MRDPQEPQVGWYFNHDGILCRSSTRRIFEAEYPQFVGEQWSMNGLLSSPAGGAEVQRG